MRGSCGDGNQNLQMLAKNALMCCVFATSELSGHVSTAICRAYASRSAPYNSSSLFLPLSLYECPV